MRPITASGSLDQPPPLPIDRSLPGAGHSLRLQGQVESLWSTNQRLRRELAGRRLLSAVIGFAVGVAVELAVAHWWLS